MALRAERGFLAMTRVRDSLHRVRPVLKSAGRLVSATLSLALRALLVLGLLGLAGLEWGLPRLAKKTRPLRKRFRKRMRREWRKVTLTPLRTAVSAIVLAVVALNGTVRLAGGDAGWLDPRHLSDKARAVGHLGWHRVWHGGDGKVADHIAAAARETGVPARWLWAFARTESGLRPHVISHAGAMGLMQLMPDTAREMGVKDPFDPAENVLGGARYLAMLRVRYGGDLERVAAAYHAGPNAVPVKGKLRVGAVTRRYVSKIRSRSAPRAP